MIEDLSAILLELSQIDRNMRAIAETPTWQRLVRQLSPAAQATVRELLEEIQKTTNSMLLDLEPWPEGDEGDDPYGLAR